MNRIALVAVTIAIFAQVLRAAFPAFGHLAGTSGPAAVLAAVLLPSLAGLLAPAVRGVAGPRGLVTIGVGGLLVFRLVAQMSPTIIPAVAGTAFGVLAVTALYEAARGLSGTGFAVAVVAGLTGDTALRLAFGTWAPPSRPGTAAWLVTVVLVGVGAGVLSRWRRTPLLEPPVIGWRDALGAAGLGPFLALEILVLGSPAFAASSGGLPLPAAGAVVLAGQALALAFLSSGLAVAAVPGGVCVLGGTLLGLGAAAVTGRYGLTGVVAIAVVVLGQVLAAWLLAVACRVPLRRGGYRGRPAERGGPPPDVAVPDTGGRAWRIGLGGAVGWPIAAIVLLGYQAHYFAPLPLPNKVLPGAAGIVLGLLSAIAAARGGPLPARSTVRALAAGGGALLLLLVPAAYALATSGTGRTAALPGTFRLVSYDIGQAVGSGRLDLEAVARAIEAQHADVVALQGAGRGWPASGTADEGAWLARRLKMRLVWGPAADHQYGNAVLSRLRVLATGTGRLPVGAGPQAPGYVWARVTSGGGRTADVWSVRLQQGADRGTTRQAEIAELLQAWSGAPHTVIAADLGAGPGSPEAAGMTARGALRSAFDTPPAAADAVFGTADLGFDSTAVGAGTAHRPVAATVRVIG